MYKSLSINNKIDNTKLKYTVSKALDKFIIVLGIKLTAPIPVFYSWNKKKYPKWELDENTNSLEPETPYFTVDFDKKKRYWHLGYIYNSKIITHCTLDDTTGTCSLLVD